MILDGEGLHREAAEEGSPTEGNKGGVVRGAPLGEDQNGRFLALLAELLPLLNILHDLFSLLVRA